MITTKSQADKQDYNCDSILRNGIYSIICTYYMYNKKILNGHDYWRAI